MTLEMQTALERELKDAKTPEARADAMTLAMIAMVDCQQKTSAR